MLAQRLLDAGYLLAPGQLFDPLQQPSTRMCINFTQTQDARVRHQNAKTAIFQARRLYGSSTWMRFSDRQRNGNHAT